MKAESKLCQVVEGQKTCSSISLAMAPAAITQIRFVR